MQPGSTCRKQVDRRLGVALHVPRVDLRKLKDHGYPVIGMSWFGDEVQVGWHYALTGPNGKEETLAGLFYKGKEQPVAAYFCELMKKGCNRVSVSYAYYIL